MLELEFETSQKKACLELERMGSENSKVATEAAAAEQVLAAAKERQKMEAQQHQEALHEEFRRQRAVTITSNIEALRVLHPERGARPLSPRSMLRVEDELRTGLLGKERPDPELGRPLYCSKFLKEELLLTENAARERAKVFGNDVKEAMRALFPEYDLNARTNRSVDGHEREPHLYFEAHLPAFRRALLHYLARASPVRDDELSREGQTRRREQRAASRSSFFGQAANAEL